MSEEELPKVDVSERGAKLPDGSPQTMDRRLYVQLLVFDCPPGQTDGIVSKLAEELGSRGASGVVYADVNAPNGIGVLTYSENAADFVEKVRPAVGASGALVQRPGWAMLGRSYSQGHESDLQFWLIDRPKGVMENAASPWAVWYPLRRSGAFAKLEPREQAAILREHAIIGRAYGQADLAHDVRLACHGMDAADNEFVVGLIGRELNPLSHVVQAMRKTKQTSEFIVQMGPFFVGYAIKRIKP